MPPKSVAFQKIRSDALAAVRSVPVGKVTSFGEVGRLMDVMARHIAYLIATLKPEERRSVPWHRIIADDGCIGPAQMRKSGTKQIRLLRTEGVAIDARGRIENWPTVFHSFPRPKIRVGDPVRGPYLDPATPLLFPPAAKARPASLDTKLTTTRTRKRA